MSGSGERQRSGSQNYSAAKNESSTSANSWGMSDTGSSQGSMATSGQGVWGAQQGALGDLYGQSQSLMAGSNPYGQSAANIGAAGQAAWQGALVPGQNPYFDQAVQASIDQATDSFKRGTLADLDARSAGVGQLGSSRDRLATGEAAGQFGQSIAQTAAQQRAQQYSGDQDRMMQAIGMTGNMQQSAYSPLSVAASLIGGPTVLREIQSSGWGQSAGTSRNESTSLSNALGWSIGSGNSNAQMDRASGGLKSS